MCQSICFLSYLIGTRHNRKPLDNYFQKGSKELNDLKDMCQGGCYTITNKGSSGEKREQAGKIIRAIDRNLGAFDGKCFSNKFFLGLEMYFFFHEKTVGKSGKNDKSGKKVTDRMPQSEEEIE